jgi:hypothetical protein
MRFLPIVMAVLLAGCASIPLKTMYNLWNFDPWQSDFRTWRAAARLPLQGGDTIKPRIVFRVQTWHDGQQGQQLGKTEDIFALQHTTDPSDTNLLLNERRTGYAVVAYRIDPADYTRLTALRARVLASKKTSDGLHGSITVVAAACGQADLSPHGKYLVSTWLLVDVRDGYNPLTTDYDLSETLKSAEARKEMASACND